MNSELLMYWLQLWAGDGKPRLYQQVGISENTFTNIVCLHIACCLIHAEYPFIHDLPTCDLSTKRWVTKSCKQQGSNFKAGGEDKHQVNELISTNIMAGLKDDVSESRLLTGKKNNCPHRPYQRKLIEITFKHDKDLPHCRHKFSLVQSWAFEVFLVRGIHLWALLMNTSSPAHKDRCQ